ncbi:MAG: glycerol dehydrogenase [Oscillibacter sp.]|nr:glycerol dehydrogenase [Oscillibacter sp.]
MSEMLKSPAKYVQGKGVMHHLDEYLQGMGKNLMILQTAGGTRRNMDTLNACFEGKGYHIDYRQFGGECTRAKIEAWAQHCKETGITAVIGIGGGKVLDTTKGIAHYAGLPMVIVPTVCATDAPCSSLSVMYTDEGVFDAYLFLDACPNVVIVDTEVIAKAPAKMLVAGMGDAMATWFEARACRASGSDNQVHAKPTNAATCLARTCWEVLQADGVMAKMAVEQGVVTKALENVVEINTYLSGVGFESGGLAAAHGIQKGFTVIPELNETLHGEKVAFCTITQLVLENAPTDEIESVLDFCLSVGLPVCFADLGYPEVDPDAVRRAAEKACVPGSTIHNLPFTVTPDMVADALLVADALGKAYKDAE